jgi:hypothetical protein
MVVAFITRLFLIHVINLYLLFFLLLLVSVFYSYRQYVANCWLQGIQQVDGLSHVRICPFMCMSQNNAAVITSPTHAGSNRSQLKKRGKLVKPHQTWIICWFDYVASVLFFFSIANASCFVLWPVGTNVMTKKNTLSTTMIWFIIDNSISIN